MVDQVADRADTWMDRSFEDIEASDGQGYDYGLRMLSAFARVVGKCSQAHDDTTSERVDAQEKQADSLRQWNRIALHRCRCDACLHLKRINQHHLASLPLWLCEKYAELPDIKATIESLTKTMAADTTLASKKKQLEEMKQKLEEMKQKQRDIEGSLPYVVQERKKN